jgi:tetratricopeptide (TPR) repeat protein
MSRLLIAKGEGAAAERQSRDALERALRVHGAVHYDTADARVELGRALLAQGKRDEAVAAADQGLAASRAAYADAPDLVDDALLADAQAHHAAGDDAAALGLADEALQLRLKTYGPDALSIAEARQARAAILSGLHRGAEAGEELRQAARICGLHADVPADFCVSARRRRA